MGVPARPRRARSSPRRWASRAVLGGAIAVAPILAAAAQEQPAASLGGEFLTRPKLTGNWDGVRDAWAAKGVTLDYGTTYTFQGVADGGIPRTGTDLGSTLSGDLVLGLDTGKAGWWAGGSFKSRLEHRTGESAVSRAGTISPVNVDAVFPASPGNANKSVLGLTELTFTQFLSPQFGVSGGLLNTLEGDNNPIAGNLRSNTTFLNPAFLFAPVEVATVPTVALGGAAIVIPSPDVIGTMTVLNSEESAMLNPFGHGNGTTFATEWTFKHKLGGEPGGQVLGVLYGIDKTRLDIARNPRVFIADLILNRPVPRATKDSWALYYNAHQYIQGDSNSGWGPFLRFGVSDGDPNPIKWNVAAGIGGKGPFAGRSDDRWGTGFYHLDISDAGLLRGLRLRGESGGEAFYNFALTPALHLTFDAQFASSARPRQRTAVILGSRLTADF